MDRAEGGTRVGPLVIPDAELQWRFSRAGGPGGQGVNTADSRVQLRWDIATSTAVDDTQRHRLQTRLARRLVAGALLITAAEERSQRRNRSLALARLSALVESALAPPAPPRRPTRPSRGSVERRLSGKRHRGELKRLRRPDAD